MPNLESLRLTGEGVDLSTTALPRSLERLEIETRFLRATSLQAIGAADLPHLTSLGLWLGHWPDALPGFTGPEAEAYYGRATGPADVAEILSGARLPALRRLALNCCAWMPELVASVAECDVALRLEHLELSYGFMDAAQALPLLEAAPRLRNLKTLDLTYNQIFDDAIEADLRAAFGKVLVLGVQEELEGSAAARLLSF
jgi:hypothetical protein